ncbi:DUF262 domain-containing protein, partial [Microbacterium sp. ARD31]|uniref:DUF262 domain-containing protein n=1 Tax=Microbacterium sp. ARD31 TaxID=2962576 RepID=UPI002880F4E1
MSTKTELWTLDTLRTAKTEPGSAVDIDRKNPVVFTIPPFQRRLVWPPAKQQKLIESILRGYPFGSLLLVEMPDKIDVVLEDGSVVPATNYGIIDGLQRTNAITEHLKNSLLYASIDVVDGPEFDALLAALRKIGPSTLDEDVLRDQIVVWMRETRRPDISEGFDHLTLLEAIAEGLGWPSWTATKLKALTPSATKFLKHLERRVDLRQLQVPVLIYSGPKENLPDIFERINTSGTMLSKYEVFAAAW